MNTEPKMSIIDEADKKNNIEIVNTDRLRSLIERIERLEEEKKDISADIKDIYGEAKAAGYDTKIMRQIIKLRKMDSLERDEAEMLLETYRKALDL
jgi:uncharacterized protein (UPF0335 family)